MSVDPTKLAALLAMDARERPAAAAYWKVIWDANDSNQTRYYSDQLVNQMSPYGGVGVPVKAKLLENPWLDAQFEIDPDLRTETIPVTFDNIDRTITQQFQTYRSGVRCELYFYWPHVNLTVKMWSGQLQAPIMYGWKTAKTIATNGFRSRELLLPNRNKRKECGRRAFGGKLPDDDARATALCDYDPAGGVGLYKTGMTPFDDCPGETIADCVERFGHALTWGGFTLDASAVVTDGNSGYIAVTKGNNSAIRTPVRVVAGLMYVRGMQLLLWRREANASHPDHGFVSTIWEVSDGPVESIYNFKVNEKLIEQMHLNVRLGERRQARTNYAPDVSNFSHTANVFARYGWVNPLNITPASLAAEAHVKGYNQVAVYTDDSPVTKTRIWSDNRAWWLLEVYKNQKFGFGYAESEVNITEWMEAADWCDTTVETTYNFEDGESRTEVSRRSSFNAVLEGRPATEQITDIARAGGLSIPYQHEGKITVTPLRAFTTTELNNAVVFTDTGSSKNICIDDRSSGHLIEFSQVTDDRVINEVEVVFEEAANYHNARPITMDDPDQKRRAGQALGLDYLQTVPRRYSAFGITGLPECKRFARRMLWFGEFDTGGILNNGSISIICPMEWALGVRRYGPIKVVSQVIDGFTIGATVGGVDLSETLQYFRVLNIFKIPGGRCRIVAQAYNHTAYTAFEVDSVITPGAASMDVTQCGTQIVRGSYGYNGQVNSRYSSVKGPVFCTWTGTQWQFANVDGSLIWYYSTDNVDFPWEVTTWLNDEGIVPMPFVSSGAVPIPYQTPAQLTIDPPTHDPVTGIMTIAIN